MHAEIVYLNGAEVSAEALVSNDEGKIAWKSPLLANAEIDRNTRYEGDQLSVGRNADTDMPFLMPSWGFQSPGEYNGDRMMMTYPNENSRHTTPRTRRYIGTGRQPGRLRRSSLTEAHTPL
jgi:hypothetical protein